MNKSRQIKCSIIINSSSSKIPMSASTLPQPIDRGSYYIAVSKQSQQTIYTGSAGPAEMRTGELNVLHLFLGCYLASYICALCFHICSCAEDLVLTVLWFSFEPEPMYNPLV